MQVKLREMKPGTLSKELKEALGMPEGAPPPWLINMQVSCVIVSHLVCIQCFCFLMFVFICFRDMGHLHRIHT